MSASLGSSKTLNASKPKKRFVGSKSSKPSKPGVSSVISNQIPSEILEDAELSAAISQLPSNYSFEIHKTIHHVRKNNATMVALQMPEGLLMFACTIADIIERFTVALTVIMGDVTYGACCIDDYTAVALGCDMLVHYGHSCLVPVNQTSIKTLYVFVEICIDSKHLEQTIRMNFPDDRDTFHRELLHHEEDRAQIPIGSKIEVARNLLIEDGSSHQSEPERLPSSSPTRLALVSTIQFVAALQHLKDDLSVESTASTASLVSDHSKSSLTTRPSLWTGKYEATIPRSKPLSPGEILGCTAPTLNDVDALVYLGDGRFHLESIMIANPDTPAFRYDPYSKKITRERYDHVEMQRVRDNAVRAAQKSITTLSDKHLRHDDPQQLWGVVLGTLGRQGNFKQLQAITRQLEQSKLPIPHVDILLSELSPAKLALFNPHISTFVQTSCPRLSIDWGYAFDKPLLSPYEMAVVIGKLPGWVDKTAQRNETHKTAIYPMDFYAFGSPWALSRLEGTFGA